MKRLLVVACGLALAGFSGCEKKKAVAPPINVTVTPIVQKDVYETNTWVGLLDGYQNADIRAQVTGYLLTQNYKEGSAVKKGDVLFTIDPRPFEAALAQAQANYGKALAEAQLAQITLDRQVQLYKTKVISQQQYDTSYQDTQAAIAAAAAAQAQVQTAQINLNYCTITAPFDGIAGVAQAQIGDLVGPGGTSSVLTQMSQVNPIKMNFFITEQQYLGATQVLQELQNKAPEDIPARLQLKLADGKEYPQLGRFDFVNRQINTATGAVQVTALFPNDDSVLRPGLFGRITAPTKLLQNALVVPQVAVVELQGNHFISLLGADNTVASVPVKLGPVQGTDQVVQGQGLKAGAKVIVEGVEKVRPGMKVNPQPYQPAPASPAPAASPSPEKKD